MLKHYEDVGIIQSERSESGYRFYSFITTIDLIKSIRLRNYGLTLREIQNAYEAVTGKKTDTGNFRRDIKKMLVKTGNTRKVCGKQTALYRFNPMFRYLEENL